MVGRCGKSTLKRSTNPPPRCKLLPGSIRTPAHERQLEPVEAERVLRGGVGKDHVRVIEHVQAVERQRVDFKIVQRELGVDVEADVCGQCSSQVLGQAGGRLSTH